MTIKYFDRARVQTATTGTGTLALGSPVSGFRSFADAEIVDGDSFYYVIEEGAAWEVGIGTYGASGSTLTRGVKASSTGSALDLGGNAQVYASVLAEAFNEPVADGTRSWGVSPIGVWIPVSDDLAGVVVPPTDDPSFRYIKGTAGEDGTGDYNDGVLTNETITGSGRTLAATADIGLAGSPLDGQTIHLINTERRFLRAGSAGTVEDFAMQGHHHALYGTNVNLTAGGADTWRKDGTSPTEQFLTGSIDPVQEAKTDGTNGTPLVDDETRPKNLGVSYYMRIL